MAISFYQDVQQAAPPDESLSTAYDSVWAQQQASQSGLETVFLAQDKLYVVLAVVLIIWLGIVFYLYRTDRKIARLEDSLSSLEGSDGRP